jgi:phosphatidylglycerol:prolipoprotein diacylglycerol transferase
MFPDLIDIGFLHIRTYGACMAAGFLVCWRLFERLSGRRDLSNLLFAMILSGVVGSRAAYVVEHWQSEFAASPLSVIRVDQGGLMFYGGLILALVVYVVWCAVKREDALALGDHLAAVVPLGHAFGRIGCFFYGCCYGRVSDSALAVRFPRLSPAWCEQVQAGELPRTAAESLPVLPTQLFESAALLALFAAVMLVHRSRRGRGMTIGAYLAGYGIVRFALEYLRGDPRAAVGPLSISQAISTGMCALGVAAIAYAARAGRKADGR